MFKRVRARIKMTALVAVALAGVGLTGPARAAWPEKPIKLVIPFAGGGMGSVFGNMVSEVLAARLKTPVHPDYKPGANAAIGTEFVAKQPNDGYTLLMVTAGSMSVNPAFQPNLRYDSVRDFTPVGIVWMSRNVLYGNPNSGKTLAQILELGKKRSLTYGSLGLGSLAHLSSEMLIRAAHVQAAHVPYKGNGQIMTDLVGGQLDFAFTDPSGMQFAETGRVVALAVTGPRRLPSAPNVPTLAELGFPNVGMMSWLGIVAPAGTPKEIVERISAELTAGFADEAVRAKVIAAGVEVAGDMTPATFAREISTELERWKKFQRESGIKLEQ